MGNINKKKISKVYMIDSLSTFLPEDIEEQELLANKLRNTYIELLAEIIVARAKENKK